MVLVSPWGEPPAGGCKWAPSRNRGGGVSPAGCSEERGCPGGALVHSLLPPCLSRCAGSLPPRLLLRAGSPVSSAEYYVSTRSERAQQPPVRGAPSHPGPHPQSPRGGAAPGAGSPAVEGEVRGVTPAKSRWTHRLPVYVVLKSAAWRCFRVGGQASGAQGSVVHVRGGLRRSSG